MAKSEIVLRPRVLLLGGDGARSGVPRYLDQLTETLAGEVDLTILSDHNLGGYDNVAGAGAAHIELEGLRNSKNPLRLWRGWTGALRQVREGAWDVIWLHARLPALMLRVALALRLWRPSAGTRLILSYHGIPFDPGHRVWAAWASRRVERVLLRLSPPMHLVFLSSDMASRLCAVAGPRALQGHCVHVLPNSSNLGRLPLRVSDRDERQLVITGRAGYQKNYPLAARLMNHMPANYVLTLCGTGTDDPTFQARILREVAPGTQAQIRFAGSLPDVRDVLAEADGYLLTSRYEGVPIGAIEAFESGLPIVLSPFEAAPEMVAAHPMAICLSLRDLAEDAKRITRLIEKYVQDRPRAAARIRAAWWRKYPYGVWQVRVRRLMLEILAD
ncbi:glycosyltransferase family 4 protein [Roseovarius sp. LXJ103]|uniref:glycosyltransferase family 4 protein n=1 Tax=Roseovarius carneus TaxID=2853164 RepID=UPI0015E81312|nr:glycosyltransferase family 4 protein [Roseovarius carneus]MBZ8117986.1 glycosyltransferase family 4 protein [Roseovarius carneus]